MCPGALEADVKVVRRIGESRIIGGKKFVTEIERKIPAQLETQSGKSLSGKHYVILTAGHEITRSRPELIGIEYDVRAAGAGAGIGNEKGMRNWI